MIWTNSFGNRCASQAETWIYSVCRESERSRFQTEITTSVCDLTYWTVNELVWLTCCMRPSTRYTIAELWINIIWQSERYIWCFWSTLLGLLYARSSAYLYLPALPSPIFRPSNRQEANLDVGIPHYVVHGDQRWKDGGTAVVTSESRVEPHIWIAKVLW